MQLNLKESAALLDCSQRTLQRLKANGKLSSSMKNGVNYFQKKDLLNVASEVSKKSKHATKQNVTVEAPVAPKMQPFEITEEVQAEFDSIIKIVETHSPDLEALDDLVESLMRIRHYKAFYHSEVERNPLSQSTTKLLSQTIRDEISILKALKVSP